MEAAQYSFSVRLTPTLHNSYPMSLIRTPKHRRPSDILKIIWLAQDSNHLSLSLSRGGLCGCDQVT